MKLHVFDIISFPVLDLYLTAISCLQYYYVELLHLRKNKIPCFENSFYNKDWLTYGWVVHLVHGGFTGDAHHPRGKPQCRHLIC